MSFAGLVLVGVLAVGAGGGLAIARGSFAVGLAVQAAGCALLAAGGIWALAVDGSAGAAFSSALDPRAWKSDFDAAHPLEQGFWARLFTDPAFKSAHARRWDELAATAFAPAALHKMIDDFADQAFAGGR